VMMPTHENTQMCHHAHTCMQKCNHAEACM
jgi:hypothetical protein